MSSERIKRVDASLRPWLVAGLVLSVALGAGAYMFFRVAAPPEPAPGAGAFLQSTSITGPRVRVRLFFPSMDGEYLVPEERDVPEVQDLNLKVREVVEELIRGPVGELTPSFPAGARVKSVLIDDAGTVFVNFSRELQSEYPGGAWTETLTIYSLTNTLTAAFPDDVKAVQILVEGSEIPTLAGHIDTSRPFLPRTALNRG